ncbi:MAG TPA: hypothetical protein VFI47_19195 [Acidimicrobiales bacterium]|nr:hypothetical protein [Acidimicrobiales bacterium]
MTLSVDTSALLERYVEEPDSDRAEEPPRSDAAPGPRTRLGFGLPVLAFDVRRAQDARGLGLVVAGA